MKHRYMAITYIAGGSIFLIFGVVYLVEGTIPVMGWGYLIMGTLFLISGLRRFPASRLTKDRPKH